MRHRAEHPQTAESREKPPSNAWHDTRVSLLALALLVPASALAKEVQEQSPQVSVERVDEDRYAFLARLDDAARNRSLETSWTHFTSPDGESYSLHTSIPGTEREGSVMVQLDEANMRVRERYTIVTCHTHPTFVEEIPSPYMEGQSRPIDVPSTTDIESFVYRMDSILLMSRMEIGATQASITEASQRYTECVMTATGGYWTLRLADVDRLGARMNAIDAYMTESYEELARVIVSELESKSPQITALFAVSPEQAKHESTVMRALVLAATIDPESPGVHPEVARFVNRIRGIKRPLDGEPAFVRMRELAQPIVDSARPFEKTVADMEAYLAFVREEFGVQVEWHPLPRGNATE
ncbi:MAG: hypothetical protein KBD05_02000 [Candidatus Pacebacteria bacterium]|nr:hypothetical protein [Candidatus Paceibacterota bacterium]